MGFNHYEDEETDHIPAEADIVIADKPRLTPEILGAVTSLTKLGCQRHREGWEPEENYGEERASPP